jgi:TorA maturation chaperone TorD
MAHSSATDHIATIYRFCAQSMKYPESSWLTEEYFSGLFELLALLGGEGQMRELQAAIETSADFLEDIQVEHTRLFINGAPHVAAPPYGSVYLDKSLQGKYSEDVLIYYHSQGYTISEQADLPDNLVHQLEFLSFLAEDKNRAGEEEFLQRYFLPWYTLFSAKVKEEIQHPFYQVIINIIDFFTKEEKEYDVQSDEA